MKNKTKQNKKKQQQQQQKQQPVSIMHYPTPILFCMPFQFQAEDADINNVLTFTLGSHQK